MFYGEYAHSIDRKGRLIIPSKFRQVLKTNSIDKVFLTRGFDRCLFVFAEPEWRTAEARFKEVSFTKAEGRKFNRLFFSGATELQLDRLGRLLIPKHLKEFAQITQEVMVVGVATRIEIWAKDKWQQFYDTSQQSYEELAERILLE